MSGVGEDASATLRWRQEAGKLLWLLSLAVPATGTLCLMLYAAGQPWAAWVTPFLLLAVLPACEMLCAAGAKAAPNWATPELDASGYHRALAIAYIPLQYACGVAGAWLAVTQAGPWAWAGLVLTVGAINGIGLNVAHELGHKRGALSRWLAGVANAPVGYGQYIVAHQRGHHIQVATPEDPASARYGEGFWRYLLRTTADSWRLAWRLERQRLRNRGRSAWSFGNEILRTDLMTLALFASLTAWLGWAALPFLLLQAAYGTSVLEGAGYIQHYGLRRRRQADGRHEPVGPGHTWDGHGIANLLFYQVERHADHHMHPARSYQALRPVDGAPVLPCGYASLTILAYVPPLWFRVMNPLVARHYGGDLSLANHG